MTPRSLTVHPVSEGQVDRSLMTTNDGEELPTTSRPSSTNSLHVTATSLETCQESCCCCGSGVVTGLICCGMWVTVVVGVPRSSEASLVYAKIC